MLLSQMILSLQVQDHQKILQLWSWCILVHLSDPAKRHLAPLLPSGVAKGVHGPPAAPSEAATLATLASLAFLAGGAAFFSRHG
jgi:hypothetical protein